MTAARELPANIEAEQALRGAPPSPPARNAAARCTARWPAREITCGFGATGRASGR